VKCVFRAIRAAPLSHDGSKRKTPTLTGKTQVVHYFLVGVKRVLPAPEDHHVHMPHPVAMHRARVRCQAGQLHGLVSTCVSGGSAGFASVGGVQRVAVRIPPEHR
jgi:hypothetical protein